VVPKVGPIDIGIIHRFCRPHVPVGRKGTKIGITKLSLRSTLLRDDNNLGAMETSLISVSTWGLLVKNDTTQCFHMRTTVGIENESESVNLVSGVLVMDLN
jgi:hypothetical protein